MEAFAGHTVCRRRDEHGLLEVVETDTTRTLYFGTPAKQSSMALEAPHRLALSYTRAMAAALLFNPRPRSALLIGLGGGSLARFLLHHLPDCRVDAAEPRSAVIDIAREHFALAEHPRLRIFPVGGAEFLAGQPPDTYDLILVDAFDASGLAAEVTTDSFMQACHSVLTADGVLSVNLWASRRELCRDQFRLLADRFDNQVLRLPVERRGNVIALARHRPWDAGLKGLRSRAAELQARYEMNFPGLLRSLRRHNTSLLRRMLWP